MMGRGGGGGRCSKLPRSATPIHDHNTPRLRDSDASSSRSSALLTDKASQSAALRSVNAFLASHSAPLTLKPLPSARDLTKILLFVLSRLEWSISDLKFGLESDLPLLLSRLDCPLKLNKSALKTPGTPHNWPPLLFAINWLVQLAAYTEHCSSTTSTPNDILSYVFHSYNHFFRADDDAVTDLDNEYCQKMQHAVESATATNATLAQENTNLEAKLHSLTTAPSRAQALREERDLLVEDLKKLEKVVETWRAKVATKEARLGGREMELEKKEGEVRRLRADNVELKLRVDTQGMSVRDVERMRRELQATEQHTAEAECARNAAEDKAWDLEADVGRKFREIESMAVQCNQAIRKLKLGNDFEFVPNAKGSSPAEVMGIDYKATLKPALNKLLDDANEIYISKRDEYMNLQNKSLKVAAVLEDKRKSLATLEAKCEEAEGCLNLINKEIEEGASKLAAETGKIRDEFARNEQELEILEKEAENFLKDSEQRLQEAVKESEDETQLCARDLLAVIDAVSEYKEYMESTISGMQKDLEETAQFVAEAHKCFVSRAPNLIGALKRARCSPPTEPSSRAPNLIGDLKRARSSPPTEPSSSAPNLIGHLKRARSSPPTEPS